MAMSKGLGVLFIAVLALIGGAVFAAFAIRKRIIGREIDFDDFDTAVEDEEFEQFFEKSVEREFPSEESKQSN